jgi:hypothetical protein
MKNRTTIMIFVISLYMSACSQIGKEQSLKAFVDDPGNKITQVITVGDVGVVSRFLPDSYRSLIEEKKDPISNGNKGFYYFNIKFNKKVTDKPDKEKMMYLNFDMQNDFVLVTGKKDSVMPAICQKIENGIKGSYEYMLAFEKKENDGGDFTLLYNDNIFSIGTVAFVYNEKDILKIPGTK